MLASFALSPLPLPLRRPVTARVKSGNAVMTQQIGGQAPGEITNTVNGINSEDAARKATGNNTRKPGEEPAARGKELVRKIR